jgi:choline dehydrogenase
MAAPPSVGTYDYVIVGAGSAGCVLANRLSADPGIRVLLLEAGGRDDWIWIHIPAGYLYCIGNPRTDWMYRTEAEAGLNGRAIHYARGKVLGGCSSINGMIYMRGQARDYDEWARLTGDDSWSWNSVLPVFKASEDHWRGSSTMHGAGGEWRVEKQRLRWDILEAFEAAANQMGIPRTEDFNGGNNLGTGSFEVNQRRGVRLNASKAFLRPVMKRPNLTVITGAHIDALQFDEADPRRVTGVTFFTDDGVRQASARAEVVLAAGALGSPRILQHSGIGPASLLREIGLPVRHDLAGVGDNLQDHLQLRMAFRVTGVKTLNQMVGTLWGRAMIGLTYALQRNGPLTMAPSQLGIFACSGPEQATPDLEFHVQPLSLDKFGDPLHGFPAFTASVCNLRPHSRGTVRIRSADTRAAPAISPNYLSHEEDRRVAVRSLRLAREIAGQPALAGYRPEEFMPGPQAQRDEELAQAAGDIGTTIFHPVGTCRMGAADDPHAVTDSRLRVLGIRGLRVVDASVMPTITSGNTNSPTIMIAERGARMILDDRKPG